MNRMLVLGASLNATPTAAPLGSPGLWLIGAERGALIVGLAIALGGQAGAGLARHYKGTLPAPLPGPWALRGSLLGAAASAALLITAIADPGLAASLSHPLVLGLRGRATAVIALIELAFFVLAAVLLWARRASTSVLPLVGVVLAEAVRSHSDGMIPAAGAMLTICHLLPAVLWVGMLLYVVRTAFAWRSDPAAVHGLIKLYSNTAAWLFAVIVITGLIEAFLLVPIGSLLTSDYGRFLIVKAVIVAVASALAVGGRYWLRRHPGPDAGPARVTRYEVGALAGVLIITGILTVVTPPARSVYTASRPASASVRVHRTPGTAPHSRRFPRPPGQTSTEPPLRQYSPWPRLRNPSSTRYRRSAA
ncbi:MAG: CopD family protein [Streptosporangiaceae bacterium]